jgi:hypothetical protein
VGVDEYGWSGDGGIPVAELSEEQRARRRRRRPRVWRFVIGGLTLAVLIAGVVVAARVANRSDPARRRVAPATTDDAQARLDVLGALNTTIASGSYAIHSTMTETLPNGTSARAPIVAEGTVNVDPVVVVATSNVAGAGAITARIDDTNVWEAGGANFGMSADATAGPGAPLSQFATLVAGSLGLRAGAVAMQSMASPNGYLHVAQEGVTTASSLGDATFDGVAVHVYEVDVDAAKLLERPGLTPEELKAGTAALAEMRVQGYRTTTVRLSIDGRGFVRRTQTSVRFADGGSVDADVKFSDFGCSGVVMLPNGPSIVPAPAGCAAAP